MNVTSLFHKIGGGIKKVVAVVSHTFVALFGPQASQEFADAALKLLNSEIGKIVLDAVESFQNVTPALAGAVKRAQAFSKIEADLKTAGHDIPASMINLLIELGVQFLQGHFSAQMATAIAGADSSGGSSGTAGSGGTDQPPTPPAV